MASNREILTERGEAAYALGMQTLGLYRQWSHTEMTTRLPHSGMSPGESTRFLSPYVVIPHLVAIAEDFVRSLLIESVETQLPLEPEVVWTFWRLVEQDIEGGWSQVFEALNEWYGINCKAAPSFQKLQGFIEARNAIVHGLGNLTRKQTRTARAERRSRSMLQTAGVPIVGQRVTPNDSTVYSCATTVAEFVSWVDVASQAALKVS